MKNTNVEDNLKQIRERSLDTVKELGELKAGADNGFLRSLNDIQSKSLSIVENIDEILGRRATRPHSGS